jgi:2-C-methyl-D-erythritol 4-phosphate cytidylyltransferase
VVVEGGSTRSGSVRAGLRAVPGSAEVIVVHDAARPLASPSLFRAALDALADGSVAGAVCAVPLVDTVKQVRDGTITGTLERRSLVAVQTPQAFRADVLRRAYRGTAEASDDAGLVEAVGGRVVVVPGHPDNLKLTSPDDLARLDRLLGP